MRNLSNLSRLFIAAAIAAWLPLALAAQDTSLKDFSKTMMSDELLLNIIPQCQPVPLLFKPLTLYQIRAKASESTMVMQAGNGNAESIRRPSRSNRTECLIRDAVERA
jgi:hypothetical protein